MNFWLNNGSRNKGVIATASQYGLSKQQRTAQQLLLIFCDVLGIVLCSLIALFINNIGLDHPTFPYMQLLAIIIAPIGFAIGGYERKVLVWPGLSCLKGLQSLIYANVLVLVMLFALQTTASVSRLALSIEFCMSSLWIVFTRIALTWFNKIRAVHSPDRTLVIEDGLQAPKERFSNYARFEGLDVNLAAINPESLRNIGHAVYNIDRVIVFCSAEKRDAWADILRSIDAQGELYDENATDLRAIGASSFADKYTLILSAHPLTAGQRATKRMFDIAAAIFGLILFSPFLLGAMIAILIEDGRPILFKQQRIGQSNRPFQIYKFRSMYTRHGDLSASMLTRRGDERVTRVGRFIRATSIDELPQLFNVLLGQMSIVGPRPHAAMAKAGGKHYFQVDSRYWHRHKLRPGLTGLAQVRGFRGATDHEIHLRDRLGADLEYLIDWSIWRDLRIVLATLRVLVHSRAY